MKPVKLIFFDIDGTLFDHANKQIPDSTRKALHQLREKGILLCVATGRPTATLPDFGDIHFDIYATFNGCLCFTQEKVIHSDAIGPETVSRIIQNVTDLGRPISVALADRLVANGVEADLADYYALAGLELTTAPDFAESCKEPVYQLMMGSREEEFPAILEGTQGVKIAVSWDRAVDVISATGGKGTAVEKILEFYGLDKSQSMAFGDNNNDIEMLQAAGIGVAMGNATKDLKAVADAICPAVSEDGIYRFCKEMGPI